MYNKLKQGEEVKTSYQQDEIDLHYIFGKIGEGFLSFFGLIGYVLMVARKRALIILLFLALGVGIGYVVYKTTKPYYMSSMTLILSNIRNEFMKDQLDKLSDLIKEENFEAVSDRLDIDVDAARQIKDMTFSNLDQDRVAEDSILTGSPFRIQLKLYQKDLFSTMEPALTDYLEKNPYFTKQKKIRQQRMQNMIAKYKDEIRSLDSIKTTVSAPRGPVNGFVYGQPIDPSNLYRESISMYQQQVELEAELEQMDNVEVVTGFVQRLRPSGPNLLKYEAIAVFIAFFAGLVVALVLENRARRSIQV
ncbi:chain length determinant protein [Pontibacter chitinilyticus]|uniref:chain length determinant protein n=1 Tax=Pontibacter chitinilyticus TaxID=2674989 RepID=UPI00321B71DC